MKAVGKASTADDAMDALSDGRRRKLLVALLDHGPRETSAVGPGDGDGETSAVECLVAMNHLHLPKLAEYRFVDWDRSAHEVERGPRFDEIRPLLELLDDRDGRTPVGVATSRADGPGVEQNAFEGTLSYAVIESVAARERVAPHRLEAPLYETISPDALDSLFRHSPGSVVFEFHDYIVTVGNDGEVTLTDAY